MIVYTSTKSKPKRIPKAKLLQYEQWCVKHSISVGARRKPLSAGKDVSPVAITKVMPRETVRYPSKDSKVTGAVTTNNKSLKYTGTNMLGIAAMHKSNLVPIFAEEAAIEVSQMRRS
jgi:hypothetical protein